MVSVHEVRLSHQAKQNEFNKQGQLAHPIAKAATDPLWHYLICVPLQVVIATYKEVSLCAASLCESGTSKRASFCQGIVTHGASL